MEKIKKALRLVFLVFLMLLASVGMSLTGAAPVLPKHKETVMEDEKSAKKENAEDTQEPQEERAKF